MKNPAKGRANPGFTLLELLVALAVFALIASLCYAALAPAGDVFRMLRTQRDILESSYQFDRRLRMDVSYMMVSNDASLSALEIRHDQRGGNAFDALDLLISSEQSPLPVRVRYAIDEESGFLERQSSPAWLRDAEPMVWRMQRADSFEVQALDESGRWLDTWQNPKSASVDQPKRLPLAVRVRWREGAGIAHELLLPVFIAGAGR